MTISESTSRALFFRELREKTSFHHKAMEETELSKAILQENISLEEYGNYLKAMYAFEKNFEITYFPLLKKVFTDLDSRKRAKDLEKDLISLGDSTDLDFEVFDASHISLEQAVGAMYVMQGSSLGGRVILKHVNKILGLDADSGAAYFYGYGSETGKMWTSFLDEMWAFVENNPNQNEIIEGAIETYKKLQERFSREEKYAV